MGGYLHLYNLTVGSRRDHDAVLTAAGRATEAVAFLPNLEAAHASVEDFLVTAETLCVLRDTAGARAALERVYTLLPNSPSREAADLRPPNGSDFRAVAELQRARADKLVRRLS